MMSCRLLGILVFCLPLAALASVVQDKEFCHAKLSSKNLVLPAASTTSAEIKRCHRWWVNKKAPALIVPLRFADAGDNEQIVYFDHQAAHRPGPLPDFIRFDLSTKKFNLDLDRFVAVVDDYRRYQDAFAMMRAGGDRVLPTLSCDHRDRIADGYTLCQMVYQNLATGKKWIECYFGYYASGRLSISYESSLLDADSAADMAVLRNMTALFKSIDTSPAP